MTQKLVTRSLTARYLAADVGRRPLVSERADPAHVQNVGLALEERLLTRPAFLEAAEVTRLETDLNTVVDLLFSLPDRLFGGDLYAFGAAVGLRSDQVRLALRTPVPEPARIGRADLYRDDTGFRLLEFNLSSALGGLQIPELNRLLLADNGLARFAHAEELTFPDTVAVLAEVITTTARNAGHFAAPCRVALMDCVSGYRATEPEIRVLAQLLAPLGVEAVPCHMGQVREAGGRVFVDGRPIDVVYRFFTLGELTADAASRAAAEELLDALARCDVPVLSPLCTSMHGNKRALAMLWEDKCQEVLAPSEKDLVQRLLPWTRELCQGTARIQQETVDLLDHCRRHRERLVLKPAHGLGGTGTVLGRSVTEAEWVSHLDRALQRPHIVQELVTPQPELFLTTDPTDPSGAAEPAPWVLNWGAFLLGRRYAGAFLRGLPVERADVISYAERAYAGCVFQGHTGRTLPEQ
ncbi:glutathionylspermidine synthase family protein [Streptomyces sp. HSG2]|uniref:glutathionylspermidine synthase family protein n=1 Tax=Streptomyces sp. HSG2 TaxID=2797167 RepID=UPI0019078658|nr:glutathionylspermidine synthase family protein [Streptomyces sp. HSG2]